MYAPLRKVQGSIFQLFHLNMKKRIYVNKTILCDCDIFKMLCHLSQSKKVVRWQKQCNVYLEAKVHTFLPIVIYYGPYVDCMKIVFGPYINHILTKLLII